MVKRHLVLARCAALAAAGTFTLPSFAGEDTKQVVGKETTPVEQIKESCITGDLGVNVVSQYITRGLILEDSGFIAQPYADLYFKLYEGEGFLNKITLNLGIWSSIHSEHTDAGLASGSDNSTTASWYEFDYTVGVSFVFAKNFTFTPTYMEYLSPNDAFITARFIQFKLAYDDTDLLGKFALHPYGVFEVYLDNSTTGNGGIDDPLYYEVGIAPGFSAGPVALTFPVKAGFGSNEFYAYDEAFGYVAAGVAASVPLTFIPECYGKWALNTSATYYHLGEALDGPEDPVVRSDGSDTFVFTGGIGMTF